MATYHSGGAATVTVNGTELPMKNWNVDPNMRIAGTDNSKSGGFILREGSGGKTCRFSFVADHDFDQNPYATPLSLTVGQKVTNVKLYLNGTSGKYWNFPSAVVAATPMSADHEGTTMLNGTFTFDSDGTFSYPDGVTP